MGLITWPPESLTLRHVLLRACLVDKKLCSHHTRYLSWCKTQQQFIHGCGTRRSCCMLQIPCIRPCVSVQQACSPSFQNIPCILFRYPIHRLPTANPKHIPAAPCPGNPAHMQNAPGKAVPPRTRTVLILAKHLLARPQPRRTHSMRPSRRRSHRRGSSARR